ncbi:MAG: hypothetical protein H0V20_08135 [Actinobacteria bacterium]|nr:hypothetical protein [Actinomycetota bacterium]
MRLFRLVMTIAATSLVLASPATAHNPNEQGFVHCGLAVENQIDIEVEAGGGPKAGILAPTNCDHFFFAIGAIGNENSGGP